MKNQILLINLNLVIKIKEIILKENFEIIRQVPKVLLHDHLDGGLRPQTVIELAREINYDGLPTDDPIELAEWFHRGANKGSLPEYLQGFAHTCGVMQTKEALERVAYEMIEDMYNDGVVYVETRFAPVFHTSKGLTREEVVEAVLSGLERGKQKYNVEYGLIICAMRDQKISLEIAELAVKYREKGVVGFDLAGEEGGYPPKAHIDAFEYIQRENFNITIHAGEGFGKDSIWQALQWCNAHRIGHATKLIEDVELEEGRILKKMGYLAQYILDKRIPLEICLLSNVHTGAVKNLESHPFGILYKYKFRVFINTDDRLMSDTSMTKEFQVAVEHFDIELDDMEKLTINAMKSAFIPYKDRIRIIYDVIKPGYQKMRTQLLSLK